MLNRAYSLLEIKSVDEDERVITGIATTPTADRDGDIVEPKGAEFKLPIPLLWQHDSKQPIGEVFYAKVTSAGIEIKARIAKITEPGTLKDRIDEAWQSIKARLVKGLSIGFRPIESARIGDSYTFRFMKWLWLELSAVTIPANADASIQTIKSLDVGRPAATGTGRESSNTPGDTGASRAKARSSKGSMKTTAEKILALKADRAAKLEKMNELSSAVPDGETMGEAQLEESKEIKADVKALNAEIERLEEEQELNKSAAVPVSGQSQAKGTESRETGSSRVVTLKRQVAPGMRLTRAAMCIMAAKGSRSDAMAFASEFYRDDPGIVEFIKTAVGAGTTAVGAPAAQYRDIVGEFIEYLWPMTVLGKFGTTVTLPNGGTINYPSLTRVDFYTRTGRQTTATDGFWVGEGKPIPLTRGAFDTVTLAALKVGAIAALTKESVRFGVPSSEERVRNSLKSGILKAIDSALLDPTNAGSAGVKPAAITYNVAATAVSSTTAAALRVDLKNLIGTMISAGIQGGSLALIMSQGTALSLSLMRNALGNREFPDLTMRGGYLEGIPVIVSESVTTLGSPTANMIVAVNAEDVLLADDGAVDIEASDQASLEMSDAPAQDGTTGSGASMVSLWQSGMLGLKATREINWTLARASAVQYLSGVAYVPS